MYCRVESNNYYKRIQHSIAVMKTCLGSVILGVLLSYRKHVYFNVAISVRAVAVLVVQNAVLRVWPFGWRWPGISESLCARR